MDLERPGGGRKRKEEQGIKRETGEKEEDLGRRRGDHRGQALSC